MNLMPTPPDIVSCDQEPIHTPGSIQPHGMMLVADRGNFHVQHVAGEIEHRLGVIAWQDRPLSVLVGDALSQEIATLLEPGAIGGFMGQLKTAMGEMLDVMAHLSAAYIIVELETASTQELSASRVMDRVAVAAAEFERAISVTTLGERAVVEFRHLTGFDRVMLYHFLDDGTGRVLAEDKRDDLHAFLHHHFPASDIPRQARALYLRNLLRVIPDSSYQPVALRPQWIASNPLDMSDSGLRSVSPLHLKYLGNMGVRGSASLSIVKDDVLWGLIACHNETPRLLTYDVRAACRLLAGSLARQIKANEEATGYRQRFRLRSLEDDVITLLSREGSLDDALWNYLDEISQMMGSNGVAILRGQSLIISGVCPNESDIRDLAVWLMGRTSEPVFSTNRLSYYYPAASGFQQSGSGVLAIILSSDEPCVLIWFRVEQIETIHWAGNPHKVESSDPNEPLTPRASFAAWAEIVRGRSRDWPLPEVDAAIRLRVILLEAQQNRRVLELNRQLTKILLEKDMLLQQKEFLISEVNHRVQNSLSLVSSYLALQARGSENSELHVALEEARRRLTAVALVHRRLYRGDQIEVVNAARYIEELCADTFSFMGQDWAQHLKLHLAPVLVSTDRAVTLGLVLTELLINSNKYAYKGAAGPIEIDLTEDCTYLRMIVSDKGSGRASSRKGFGSRIMEKLVQQLCGELVQSDNHPGLRVAVIVPVQAPK